MKFAIIYYSKTTYLFSFIIYSVGNQFYSDICFNITCVLHLN